MRNLQHGYLTDVQRGEKLFTAVGPKFQLQEYDELSFIGAPACARELQRINGLVPVHGGAHKLQLNHHQRCLVEVVIGEEFPGLNKTVKEAEFRSRYRAAILSISRGGRRRPGKVGDMTLRVGDTLLLETSDTFIEQYQHRRDFMLVSPLRDSTPPNFSKAPLAIGILVVMVAVNVMDFMSVLEVALLASGLLLATGCVTVNRARMNVSINLPVLVVIGAAFGLGTALEVSGAATWIVEILLGSGIESPWLALLLVYIVTSLFTEVITNNAAAVLLFPIAVGVAEQLGVNPMPFIIAVMFGASASFLTPLGYQTNLMVMGPGGYRFTDYLRIGIPMAILATIVTTALIPVVWPFGV